MKHKKLRMKYLGRKEAELPTYTCRICKNYVQYGWREMKAYCDGEYQVFAELKEKNQQMVKRPITEIFDWPHTARPRKNGGK